MLAVLRHRNLALLVAAQTISFTGSFVLFVGLPFYVYELTGSGLATGALFMAQTIPQLALGSVAGVFVDRWDRRHIRMTADVVRVVVLLPLLAVLRLLLLCNSTQHTIPQSHPVRLQPTNSFNATQQLNKGPVKFLERCHDC